MTLFGCCPKNILVLLIQLVIVLENTCVVFFNSSEGCQHLELDFVPFQLTHAEIFVRGRQEVVFLLCGSDECVHMFCEDRTQQRFEEQPVGDYFPELQNLPMFCG